MADTFIKLESIGDAHRDKYYQFTKGRVRMSRQNKEAQVARSLMKRRPYVKLLTGVNSKGFLCGKKQPFKKDYSSPDNEMGDRGITYDYMLKDRHPYEVQRQISWKKSIKLYIIPIDGILNELTKEQMKVILK